MISKLSGLRRPGGHSRPSTAGSKSGGEPTECVLVGASDLSDVNARAFRDVLVRLLPPIDAMDDVVLFVGELGQSNVQGQPRVRFRSDRLMLFDSPTSAGRHEVAD